MPIGMPQRKGDYYRDAYGDAYMDAHEVLIGMSIGKGEMYLTKLYLFHLP